MKQTIIAKIRKRVVSAERWVDYWQRLINEAPDDTSDKKIAVWSWRRNNYERTARSYRDWLARYAGVVRESEP